MKRPLAITVLGWSSLALAALGLLIGFYLALAESHGSHIYPTSHTVPIGALVFPVIVGVSLLKWPRSGVLLVHAAFATLVLGEAIGWLHMAAFWRKWPEFGISWQPAAFWLLALAVTLPFWSKTPWSMERDQP